MSATALIDNTLDALRKADAFTDEQIALFVKVGDNLPSRSAADFEAMGLNRAETVLAERTIHDTVATFGVTEEVKVTIPEKPPYLKDFGWPAELGELDDDGNPEIIKPASSGDYDPHDSTQFVNVGDQMFRWAGNRTTLRPFGDRHEIAIIDHKSIDGVLMPNQEQARKAMADGKQWFNRHYNCWINVDGKPLSFVSRKQLNDVRRVGSGSSTARVA